MHIAILGTRGYPSTYGGFETFVGRLAPFLQTRGHRVTVFGRSEGRRTETFVDGVRVVDTVGISGKNTSTLTHGLTATFRSALERPDVVLMLNVANGFGAPLLKLRGIPVVINVDGIEWKRAKWGRLARLVFRGGARASVHFADELVVDSEAVGRAWSEKFSVPTTYIPYGGDVIEVTNLSGLDALGLTPEGYVLAVARLAPENNVGLLLDAFEELGWPAPLVIVGTDPAARDLTARLKTLHGDGLVNWLGHISDQGLLAQLWAGAGVYFHGHSVGGTNPALLQALGYGAPAVAVDTEFNREVLGPEGCFVRPNPSEVGETIIDVLGDEVERRRLTELGRAVVSDRYQWARVLEAYEAILRSASQLDKRARRRPANTYSEER